MNHRIGDIVRTPALGVCANKLAIVTSAGTNATTVHTGKAELVYENERLIPVARIDVRGRAYTTPVSRNRFQKCVVRWADGRKEELHVKVGDRDGHETRALEVRRLAFLKLAERDNA